ncbi:hypothetical protein CPK_ORF00722 [Chlamydia pneumoniae LPCoLN]|nr:hypothetical protein CPK_ORF00722 [Chlamydia pneumoniae LPCoLN]
MMLESSDSHPVSQAFPLEAKKTPKTTTEKVWNPKINSFTDKNPFNLQHFG